MPVTIVINPEQRLIVTTGSGIVTDEEFMLARQEFLAHPQFDPTFDRIWDFFGVVETRVSEKVATRLIAESPASEKPICRAVVMSERSGPMKAIIDFISQTRRANRRIAAFPTLASAEKWVMAARVDLPPE